MQRFEEEQNIGEVIEKDFKDIERKMHILELRDKRQGKETPARGSEEYVARLKRVINEEGRDRQLENALFDPAKSQGMTMQQKWETMRINEHQFICPPELMETAKSQRELLGERVADGLFLQEDFVRQYMDKNYNPEVDPKLHYDKASLDARRDIEGEMMANLKKGVVYDEEAAERAAEGVPVSHTAGFTK